MMFERIVYWWNVMAGAFTFWLFLNTKTLFGAHTFLFLTISTVCGTLFLAHSKEMEAFENGRSR